jgi:hypothetical protein
VSAKYLGSCEALRERFPELNDISCCNSCHDDESEYGYELLSLDAEGEGSYYVCCGLIDAAMAVFNER